MLNNQVRIVIIGPPESGKTQICSRFIDNKFTSKHQPTQVIEFLPTNNKLKCNNQIDVLLYDTSGLQDHETNNNTSITLGTTADAILVVLNAQNNQDLKYQVSHYIEMILDANYKQSPKPSVFFAFNKFKANEHEESLFDSFVTDQKQLLQQNQFNVPCNNYYVNAKYNQNINKLFEDIVVFTMKNNKKDETIFSKWEKQARVGYLPMAADTKKIHADMQDYNNAEDKSEAYRKVMKSTSKWLNSFSRVFALPGRVDTIKLLRRELYYNQCKKLLNSYNHPEYELNPYSQLLSSLDNFINTKVNNENIISGHLQAIIDIIKSQNTQQYRDDIDKCLNIQRIATHYSKSTGQEIVRLFSNLSPARREEKQWVSELMSIIKKTSLDVLDEEHGNGMSRTYGIQKLETYLRSYDAQQQQGIKQAYRQLSYNRVL